MSIKHRGGGAKTKGRMAALMWTAILLILANSTVCVKGDEASPMAPHHHFKRLEKFKASLHVTVSTPKSTPTSTLQGPSGTRVYHVTSYGADPTGKVDSTDALDRALSDAYNSPSVGSLLEGIRNLGGSQINLEGGDFLISRPLRLPGAGVGNIVIQGGTLRASDNFTSDGYLIDLSSSPAAAVVKDKKPRKRNSTDIVIAKLAASSSYNYEYITFRDLLFDSNFRGGGISIINSLRTNIDNCYFTHFTTIGISVQSGHETYIRNSFLGQHITAGGDPGERSFSGTGISLAGNDNAITDVIIFSAAIGIVISGQANILSGVHCYNKATGFGGIGIQLRLPGLTQTRIVNSYLDYTGIIAEDPVQLHISNTFFLGDAFITLKSIRGVINGVNIVDNMFSGSGNGVSIVQLDESNGGFKTINQVVIDRNNVNGMKMKSTVGKAELEGNGTSWILDFNSVLVFPNLIRNVQYSFRSNSGIGFPNHILRNVSENRVVIESDVAVSGSVYAIVDQGISSM